MNHFSEIFILWTAITILIFKPLLNLITFRLIFNFEHKVNIPMLHVFWFATW